MIEQLNNLSSVYIAAPEMWVFAMGIFTLLVSLFAGKKQISTTYTLVQLTLLISLLLSISQIGLPASTTFEGLYIADGVGNWLKIFIDIAAMSSFFYAKNYIHERNIPGVEYYLLGLFSVLGMMVLCSAHSLLMVYLGLETLSLPIYAMIALRRDIENALEASIKYFVMGAIASGMLLYGMSMLYGASGSLDLTDIALYVGTNGSLHATILSFGLVFLVAGIGFKMASVPFHMWAPDVYAGSPTAVTLFLSTAPKLAAVGMAFRLLVFALPGMHAEWQPLLIMIAALSIATGNLLAVIQTNIKRLLAYSGIGHLGYMLLGFIAGTSDGYAAALFYILIYSVMGLGAFGLITLMSRHGVEVENIEDLKGLNTRNPWLAFLMMLLMFSMAGVPPMVGFFAKLWVLKALVDINLLWLAVFGLVMAVIGAFYYIRIIKVMYFDAPPAGHEKIYIAKGARAVLSVNILVLFYLGLFPGMLMQACLSAFGL